MLTASVPFGTGAFLFSHHKLPLVPTEPAVFAWKEKTMIKEAINRISRGQDLSENESYYAISQIMSGQASEMEIAAFITGLRVKGETADELTGGVKALSDAAVRINPRVPFCVDPVGT